MPSPSGYGLSRPVGISDFVEAEVLPLGRLFDGRFQLSLSHFQRAYSWRPVHVSRLLNDLRRAVTRQSESPCYTLGRLMLVRQPGSSEAELVDGHQRVVTLTILFAALRDLETDKGRSERLHRLIASDEVPEDHPYHCRFTVQPLPAAMFRELVQAPGGTNLEPLVSRSLLSHTERNILDNRDCIRAELAAMNDEDRRTLAEFLITRCLVIVVSVAGRDEAWEMVQTEQETRLAFTAADEAKSVLLSAMQPAHRVPAARLWEACEHVLSPDDMYRLLGHLRAIGWRGRTLPARPFGPDIIEQFRLAKDGLQFMSLWLVPYASRLGDIRRGNVGDSGKVREALAQLFHFMSWVDLHAWITPVLLWLGLRGTESHTDLLMFARRLERLVWISKISGVDPGVQETRILDLLDEITSGVHPAFMTKLDIEPRLRAEAIANLRSANFAAKHYAGSLLRRYSCLIGDDPGPVDRDDLTIEHILPRNPLPGSAWQSVYHDQEICRAHHQRLGNVVFLTARDNQLAGTRPWPEKREILSRSQFALAREAAGENEWLPETILSRTDRMINRLLTHWGLEPATHDG